MINKVANVYKQDKYEPYYIPDLKLMTQYFNNSFTNGIYAHVIIKIITSNLFASDRKMIVLSFLSTEGHLFIIVVTKRKQFYYRTKIFFKISLTCCWWIRRQTWNTVQFIENI